MKTPESKRSSGGSGASISTQPCNLCRRSTSCRWLYHVAGYDVVRCEQCGLVFVPPQATLASDVVSVYSKDYFEGGCTDGYTDYSRSEDTLRRQARRALARLRRYRPSGPLLELGCAYGFFLLEAQAYYEPTGVEISEFAAREAQKRGLDVRAGDFQKLDFPKDHYSAVCLFDCIEHLATPYEYLQKIRSVLRSQGVVAITTGDIGSCYARWSGRKWRLMTPPQHLFYFSRKTLGRMLEDTGFEVLEVAYPWKLVPLGLILYQLSPGLKAALGRVANLPLGLYVNLFDAMFVLARKR